MSSASASPTVPAVDVRSLTVRYGAVTAVDGLTLSAGFGEVVALLGPNGAGKTTTVEVAEGYRRPYGGEVRVLGLDPVADRRALSPRLGVMLQDGGVYRSMGPAEALGLFASFYPRPQKPAELLELLGLLAVARTPWRRLSGGERQRLSLALSLVGRPDVVFLDEPTAGVDPQGRQVVRAVIAQLRDRGACVLLTTHELEEAQRLADRLFVITRGRLLGAGTLAELARRWVPEQVTWVTRPGLDTSALAVVLGAHVSETAPGQYSAAAAGTPATVAALAGWLGNRGLPLEGLKTGPASLEDVYLRLTAGHGPGPAEEDGRP